MSSGRRIFDMGPRLFGQSLLEGVQHQFLQAQANEQGIERLRMNVNPQMIIHPDSLLGDAFDRGFRDEQDQRRRLDDILDSQHMLTGTSSDHQQPSFNQDDINEAMRVLRREERQIHMSTPRGDSYFQRMIDNNVFNDNPPAPREEPMNWFAGVDMGQGPSEDAIHIRPSFEERMAHADNPPAFLEEPMTVLAKPYVPKENAVSNMMEAVHLAIGGVNVR